MNISETLDVSSTDFCTASTNPLFKSVSYKDLDLPENYPYITGFILDNYLTREYNVELSATEYSSFIGYIYAKGAETFFVDLPEMLGKPRVNKLYREIRDSKLININSDTIKSDIKNYNSVIESYKSASSNSISFLLTSLINYYTSSTGTTRLNTSKLVSDFNSEILDKHFRVLVYEDELKTDYNSVYNYYRKYLIDTKWFDKYKI